MNFRSLSFPASFILLASLPHSPAFARGDFANEAQALRYSPAQQSADAQDPDPDFDRLDGHGPSGKRVDVVEWEGNLEIHVYPAGSLAGLALKMDRKNKDKPVMVIGYRFDNAPKQQLIRRAILGIPIQDNFHVYRDGSDPEFDKVVITNNVLPQMIAYKLDPAPTQLYPDGHPALAGGAAPVDSAKRMPAARSKARAVDPAPMKEGSTEPGSADSVDEDGGIKFKSY